MEERIADKKRRWEIEIFSSLALFCLTVIIWVAAFVISYLQKGNAPLWISLLGLLGVILPIPGAVLAFLAIRKNREPAGLARLMFLLNLALLAIPVWIYVSGLKEVIGA